MTLLKKVYMVCVHTTYQLYRWKYISSACIINIG